MYSIVDDLEVALRVDIVRENCSWILFVNIFRGYCSWILFVDIVCGYCFKPGANSVQAAPPPINYELCESR